MESAESTATLDVLDNAREHSTVDFTILRAFLLLIARRNGIALDHKVLDPGLLVPSSDSLIAFMEFSRTTLVSIDLDSSQLQEVCHDTVEEVSVQFGNEIQGSAHFFRFNAIRTGKN